MRISHRFETSVLSQPVCNELKLAGRDLLEDSGTSISHGNRCCTRRSDDRIDQTSFVRFVLYSNFSLWIASCSALFIERWISRPNF